MSYENQAKIAADPTFQGRLNACLQKEARGKDDQLARDALSGSTFAMARMLPYVTTEPGFDVDDQSLISDGQLLSAVQAVWDDVLATYPTS